MSFKTISEEGWPDYEVWTCDVCGYSICLQGVGGDVACCPRCEGRDGDEPEPAPNDFDDEVDEG